MKLISLGNVTRVTKGNHVSPNIMGTITDNFTTIVNGEVVPCTVDGVFYQPCWNES